MSKPLRKHLAKKQKGFFSCRKPQAQDEHSAPVWKIEQFFAIQMTVGKCQSLEKCLCLSTGVRRNVLLWQHQHGPVFFFSTWQQLFLTKVLNVHRVRNGTSKQSKNFSCKKTAAAEAIAFYSQLWSCWVFCCRFWAELYFHTLYDTANPSPAICSTDPTLLASTMTDTAMTGHRQARPNWKVNLVTMYAYTT